MCMLDLQKFKLKRVAHPKVGNTECKEEGVEWERRIGREAIQIDSRPQAVEAIKIIILSMKT
jgi:hypothetical protein